MITAGELVRDYLDGGPAYPCHIGSAVYPGMTLRDWFAGMAMQALIARPAGCDDGFAEDAYWHADMMISQRNSAEADE